MSLFRKFRKVALAARYPLGRALLNRVAPALAEHGAILAEGWDVIVDIGANKGQFAVAARLLNPKATVHCVEPLDGPAETLRRVLGDSVILHRCAIGPETRSAEMYITARTDSSSLLPPSALQRATFKNTHAVARREVQVGRLSDQIEAASISGRALLKIDVQGFELEALKGCSDLLPLFHTLVVECSSAELYEGQALAAEVNTYLASQGFEAIAERNAINAGGRMLQADVIYRRRGMLIGEPAHKGGERPGTTLSAPLAR